jgi:hypothetical protein
LDSHPVGIAPAEFPDGHDRFDVPSATIMDTTCFLQSCVYFVLTVLVLVWMSVTIIPVL